MIRYRLAVALILFVMVGGTLARAQNTAAQNTESAESFARKVYADYANPDFERQDQRQRSFYTPQLYHLILADQTRYPGEVGKLDSDPICDCQDPGDPGDLKVKSIQLAPAGHARIRATVHFVIIKAPLTVVLSLLKTSSGWHIDDIATPEMPSLRRFLGTP